MTDVAWRRINHPSEALQIGQAVRVQVHPLQCGDAAHQPGHEAARGRSLGRCGGEVSAGCQVYRPRHQHHRLRRLRRTGAGRGRLGPCLRNELDEEERPPRQDRRHLPGSGRDGAGRGQLEAADFAGPQAGAAQPVGGVPRAAPGRAARSRASCAMSPNSAYSSASAADIDGMVHMSDISWDEPGEAGNGQLREGRHPAAPRCSMWTWRRSASASASSSSQEDPAADTLSRVSKGEVVTCIVTAVQANGIEVKVGRGPHRLHPPRRTGARQVRPAPGPLRRRREGGCQDHRHRPRGPQAFAHHQGARDRGGQAGGGRVRHLRQRRVAGRHPRVQRSAAATSSPRASSPRVAREPVAVGLEADLLLDRRRLKRRLVFWRVLGVLALILALPPWPLGAGTGFDARRPAAMSSAAARSPA